jgi:hypothetical protein
MEKLPIYISIVFIITVLLTVYFFWKASAYSGKVLFILGIWLLIQAQLGLTDFYTATDTVPPRFLLMVAPAIFAIIILFTTSAGRRFIDGLNIKTLTLLSVVRIPIEIVLLWLFINKAIPGAMTFEGRNFDIISGITAPVIYYYGFIKQKIGTRFILTWNFICLALVMNVVIRGLLSVPSGFQKMSFDQPNIGILYFPFVWLASVVVPLVILSHLVSIRRLIKTNVSYTIVPRSLVDSVK